MTHAIHEIPWLPSLRCAAIAAAGLYGALAAANPIDPGVRTAPTDNGPPVPLPGLGVDELSFFDDGLVRFNTVEVVSGALPNQGAGLGPRYNSTSCGSCHSQPYVGGSSPAQNPLMTIATADGATNEIPWFITAQGPIREARFVQSNGVPDGGVHNLFVVSGRADAGSCAIQQPVFTPAGNPLTGHGGNPNIVFRIPTPTLGAGLIEAIPDSAILANMAANAGPNSQLGVSGHANAILAATRNLSANDGYIRAFFGWKAQNKSLLMFAGEAYNVEMGISNQLFPQERDETANCRGRHATPGDTDNFPSPGAPLAATAVLSDIEAFANFMRMLAPPAPAAATTSTVNGRADFVSVGCAACHTPAFTTGAAIASGSARSPSPALSGKTVNLFSDLLVHHMGQGLADGDARRGGAGQISHSAARGLGERVFSLHDSRTSSLLAADFGRIRAREARPIPWCSDSTL